jgi:hypothetical protein
MKAKSGEKAKFRAFRALAIGDTSLYHVSANANAAGSNDDEKRLPAARLAGPSSGELATALHRLREHFHPWPPRPDLLHGRLRPAGLSAQKGRRRNGVEAAIRGSVDGLDA